jgi:hypothetical protein
VPTGDLKKLSSEQSDGVAIGLRTDKVAAASSHRTGIDGSPFLSRCRNAWRTLSRRPGRLHGWLWPLTIVIALIYTASFANFIGRHTSFPFYDGYGYVLKTWTLAERIHSASYPELLNPDLYFRGNQPQRPPLLMTIAAAVLGPKPSYTAVAYVWLIVRVVVILLALYLLSREFKSARFVPAAALVIFASPLTCNYYRLYFMDEPFAAFGLLAFALIVIDDKRQTMGSAMAACTGMLALFLTKPVAPAFLLPLCLVRGVRAFLPLRHHWPNLKPQLQKLLPWMAPYLLLLTIMLLILLGTPYGASIREQYKLGSTGYWHQDIDGRAAFQLISFVLPPWIWLTCLVVIPFARGFQHKAILCYAVGGFLWWLLFSFRLTYAVEDRLVGQAMPYVVTGLLFWICQRRSTAMVVTLAAAFFFVYNTYSANGRIIMGRPGGSTARRVRFLSPVPGHQRPVPEVGLVAFASSLNATLPTEKSTDVYGVFGDNYVEPNSLNLALQMSTERPQVSVRWIPVGPQRFDVARFCRTRWFITKTRRPTPRYSNTGLWTAINSVHALITESNSPLHSYFQKVLESPIHQPDLEDTLVLWHLPSRPSDSAIAEGLRWLRPRLSNDPPAFITVVDSQIQAISRKSSMNDSSQSKGDSK